MMLFSLQLRAQIIKEILCLLRDKRARFILIVPPIMQLLIFSFAITLDVRNVTVSVYNRDNGYWSQELVRTIEHAGFVKKVLVTDNPSSLHADIDRKQVLLAISIPEDFSRDIAAGQPASLQVIIDGRRANAGQIAYSYIERIVQNMGVQAQKTERIAARNFFNPNLSYRWFVVPALSGILIFVIALMTSALSIARERELGTFDQLLVSPCTPAEIIIAKCVPGFIISILLSLMMILAAVLIFGIPFTGSLLLLLIAMMVFIVSIIGIGLAISAFCSTQQQAILGVFGVMIPMVMMSGFATPVENMPQVLQWLAELMPFKHYLIILHGVFLKNMPAKEILHNTWPMLLIGCVTLSIAIISVRKKLT